MSFRETAPVANTSRFATGAGSLNDIYKHNNNNNNNNNYNLLGYYVQAISVALRDRQLIIRST
jgi:hypothetical protein